MKQVYFLLAALCLSVGQLWAQTDIASGTITPSAITSEYTGEAITPTATVVVNGTTLSPGTDYSLAYSANTNVGTAQMIATGMNSYTGTLTAQFEITPKSITGVTVQTIPDQLYTGEPIEPTLVVADGDTPLTLATDYTVTYSSNENAGTATATIEGTGNYTGTLPVTFTITPYNILGATVTAIPNQTYTGEAIEPTIEVTAEGRTLVPVQDYTVAYTENTEAGENTAVVTITGVAPNYTGTKTVNFTIEPMDISSAIITPIAPQPYTGEAIEPALTVTLGGETLTADTDYTVAYSSNTDAGVNTAVATITGEGNYTGTATANFTIEPADISTATVTAIPDQPYTGSAIEPELEITLNGTTLEEGTDYTVEYTANTAVGANTGTATITGTGNYEGTLTANFSIVAATITDADIQPINEQQYTGEAVEPAVTVIVGGRTLVANTDYTVSYTNNTNQGQAQVTVTGQGNYTGTANAVFVISDDPQPPVPPVEEGISYSVRLSLAPGINSNYSSGNYTFSTSGSRVSIIFSLDSIMNNTLTGEDILLLVNGSEANFNTFEKTDGSIYYSYFPNEGINQTIDITLKRNVIVVPRVIGATMNPSPGAHAIEIGQPFSFTMTINDDYDRSNPVVLVNGVELQPTNILRSTTYQYTLRNIPGLQVIEVRGVQRNDDSTGNVTMTEGVKVYASYGTINVETADAANVAIFTITGQQKVQRMVNGVDSFQLPNGIYIVKVGNDVYKVIVK